MSGRTHSSFSKKLIFLPAILFVSLLGFFQNCSLGGTAAFRAKSNGQSAFSASLSGGGGYDGKVYNYIDPSENCNFDGDVVNSRIKLVDSNGTPADDTDDQVAGGQEGSPPGIGPPLNS